MIEGKEIKKRCNEDVEEMINKQEVKKSEEVITKDSIGKEEGIVR